MEANEAKGALSEKAPKRYSSWQNMGYLLKNIARTDKWYLTFMILMAPVQIVVIAFEAYIPKAVIGGIGQMATLQAYLWSIFYPVLALLAAKCLSVILDSQLVKGGANQRALYMSEAYTKSMDMDYQFLASDQGQAMVDKGLTLLDQGDMTLIVKFGQRCSGLWAGLGGMIFFAGLVVKIHPWLLVFIIVSGILQYYYGKHVANFKEKMVGETRGLRAKMRYMRFRAGNYEYAKDMRMYKMADWFSDVDKELEDEWSLYRREEKKRDYGGFVLTAFMIFLRDGLTYFYLVAMFLAGSIEVADFVFLLGITRGISGWLMDIIAEVTAIHKDMAPLNDMREFFEYKDALNRDEGVPVPCRHDIQFKDVWFKYPGSEDQAIKGMNFHIKDGEKLAIVGVNGAGKSTIVGLIVGFLHPDKGEILIGGTNAEKMNIYDRYALFSAVFQDVHVFPDTVGNIVMGNDYEALDFMQNTGLGAASDSRMVSAETDARRKRVEEALEKAGLMETVKALPHGIDTYLNKMSRQGAVDLSGGQNQRLMLARAIYRDAPITVLDEPTAALDPIAESEIYESYSQMVRGKTAVFISHRLASTRFCDRILFIEDGQIAEEGSHEELMGLGGKYKEMFDIQAYYYQDNLGDESGVAASAAGGETA